MVCFTLNENLSFYIYNKLIIRFNLHFIIYNFKNTSVALFCFIKNYWIEITTCTFSQSEALFEFQ